jgi:DNA-directed RNA polymerase subunit RPC12/RpoP
MVQAAIEANFTCSCGSPFVVLNLDQAPQNQISALVMCPRHRIGQHMTLDHSALDLWASVVADHLFRCTICGREVSPVGAAQSTENAATFTLTCPVHGTHNNTRTVWNVLHRRLLSEIQQRRGQPIQPAPDAAPTPTAGTAVQGRPQAVAGEPLEKPRPMYCEQCGKKVRPNDRFCFTCGAPVEAD